MSVRSWHAIGPFLKGPFARKKYPFKPQNICILIELFQHSIQLYSFVLVRPKFLTPGRECGIHYAVGVLAVRGGVEPAHLAVFAPGGFGRWVTGDEVEDGVYAKEPGLWFEYVHGLACVVAVRCGHIFVDLVDDAVVIHVLRGGGKDLRVFRGKACAGGDEPGDVVVKFDVHLFELLGLFRLFRNVVVKYK